MDAPRPPAAIVDRASVTASLDRPVAAAQRALNKLGHGPVRADGRFGEETRAAIERFERERRLPVTRDLTPRTLRELASASGLRME
jgi:peptidoglycan hydrolase-like protein with peptidoglycan-binding domain